MAERPNPPRMILPGDDWITSQTPEFAEPPRISGNLETLIVGILIGAILSPCMIAIGKWVF